MERDKLFPHVIYLVKFASWWHQSAATTSNFALSWGEVWYLGLPR